MKVGVTPAVPLAPWAEARRARLLSVSPRSRTVNVGLRENKTQEGKRRFYRFRMPLRGRKHRFYRVSPFLSMVHVTDKHVTDM